MFNKRFILASLLFTSTLCGASSQNAQDFQSSDPAVRRQAFYSLVKTDVPKDDATRLALIDLLRKETVYMKTLTREDGAEADYYANLVMVVASMRDVRSLDILMELIDTGRMVTDAVASFGKDSLDQVTNRVDSADPGVAMGATQVIQTMLTPPFEPKVHDRASRNKIRAALRRAKTHSNEHIRAVASDAETTLQNTSVPGESQ